MATFNRGFLQSVSSVSPCVAVTSSRNASFLATNRFQNGFRISKQSQWKVSQRPLETDATSEATNQDSLEESAVAVQKKRALDLWNVVRGAVEIDDQVADTVQEKLKNGLVPPVFHAYCALVHRIRRAATKNARGNSGVASTKAIKFRADENNDADESVQQNGDSHSSANGVADGRSNLLNRPSAENVTAGELGKRRHGTELTDALEAALATPVVTDRIPLLLAIFENGNLGKDTSVDSFFDSYGKARLKVRDEALGTSWVYQESWTKAVCNLLNADAEMVGADVEVTKVESDFHLGTVRGTNATYLITRRLSRGVVTECLDMVPKDTFAIVGNPGIGKSWTLIYALQQLLLRDGANVLFFMAKDYVALACFRRSDAVYVWEAGMTRAKSDLFKSADVWVLLDPREAKEEGTKLVGGERRLLFAASNNRKHFTSHILKRFGFALHYLSLYDHDEIQAAIPYMLPSGEVFDKSVVDDRASKVGNVPRCLIADHQFQVRMKQIDNAVDEMSPALAEKILKSEGLSDGQINLPGTIFALSAAKVYDDEDESREPVHVGYDGQVGVIFTKPSLSLMNAYVFNKLAGANRERILSYWNAISKSERINMGQALENLI
jgi:hypothetical protein